MKRMEVVQGDITKEQVDAIVNAANTTLLGGGGVDGAIHRAAGPELRAYCEKLGGCATGDAKLTPGFHLPAGWVIHTAGPVWSGGSRGEKELLASCWRRCLEIAAERKFEKVAFPSISTGAYRFPVEEAARISAQICEAFLKTHDFPQLVRLVAFEEHTYKTYAAVWNKISLA